MATLQLGNFLTTLADEAGAIQGTGASIGTLSDGITALIINDTGALQGTHKIQGLTSFGKLGSPAPNVLNNNFRFYIQPVTIPASGAEMFYNIIDVSDNLKFNLRFNSAGNLQVYNFGAALTGKLINQTSSVFKTDGTFYRLEGVFGTGTNAPYVLNAAVGDGQFFETIGGTDNFGTSGGFEPGFGKDLSANNQTMACNIRHHWWSDSALPGPGRCVLLSPSMDGFYRNGTVNGAATQWQCLPQIPPDEDTTYLNNLSAGTAYTTRVLGSLRGAINSVKAYCRFRSDDGVTGVEANVRLRSGLVDTDSGNNGIIAYPSYVVWQRIFDTDPNTGQPWLSYNLNNAQVGFINNVGPGRFTSAFLMVDYLPAPPAQLVSGTFLLSLKGLNTFRNAFNFAGANAAYNPGVTTFVNDMTIDSAGLQPPFSLGYFHNTGTTAVNVKNDGVVMFALKPGQEAFAGNIAERAFAPLGQNVPAISGPGVVEYCLWK